MKHFWACANRTVSSKSRGGVYFACLSGRSYVSWLEVDCLSPELSPYGVVPKGLLTFLGSLYIDVATTISGTLVYHFVRQTARKQNLLSKNTVSSNVGFSLGNLEIAAFCILMSYFMESKLKKI